jgi:two-component system phosphate regulon sensor histidine kinase PhoR
MSDHDRLLMALPMPALRIGRDDRIAVINPAARAIFGEAALGRHFAISLRQPEMVEAIARAGRTGEPCDARLRLPGAAQDTELAAHLIPLDSGLVVVFEDLTTLAQNDQMRRDFVANVSHELRTPLTALQGFIETLQGPASKDAAARERFLQIMAAEAERMNRLVRDLLQLSRVEAVERQRPEREEDLSQLVGQAMASLQPMAQAVGVGLVVTGADRAFMVRADRDQLVQLLTNLVENALKYGSKPGGEVGIDLSEDRGPKGAVVRLSVSDAGAGIAAHHIPRLTERFYRVDDHRSREKGGTGLGLAIVKHIVNRHRGRFLIESTPGKGSLFSVLLPIS